jgi:hypothetical protein
VKEEEEGTKEAIENQRCSDTMSNIEKKRKIEYENWRGIIIVVFHVLECCIYRLYERNNNKKDHNDYLQFNSSNKLTNK